LYYAVTYTLFGQTTFYYHLLQLLFHLTCAVFLFLFFQRFLKRGISFIAAIVFLVHPINVEAVSYISQTDNPLFLSFGLIALIIATKKKLPPLCFFAIVLFSLLSIFIKETGILFFLLIILYRFLFLRHDHYLVKLIITSTVSILVYFAARFFVGHVDFSNRTLIPIAVTPLPQRLLSVPMIIYYYIKTFFYPATLLFDQQWVVTTRNFSNFYYPLLVDCIFFALNCFYGVHLYRKKSTQFKSYFFFSVWFVLGILLYLQVIPLDNTVADRWFYFPLIGLLGLMSIFIQEAILYFKFPIFASILIVTLVICLLSVRTIIRNNDWHDNVTLYSHDVQYTRSYSLENDLGTEYVFKGQDNQAIVHFKNSVDMFPIDINLFNLGQSYVNLGNYKESKVYFRQLAKHYTGSIPIATVISLLLIDNDPQDAETFINKGLFQKPKNMQLLIYLEIAEYKSGNKKTALVLAQKTFSLYPNYQTQYVLKQIIQNQPIRNSFIYRQ